MAMDANTGTARRGGTHEFDVHAVVRTESLAGFIFPTDAW